MTKFLLWGTGQVAVRNYNLLKKIDCLQDVRIVGFVDNDSRKWGTALDGVTIFPPDEIADLEWDYICIFSSYKEQILKQLVQEMNIPEEKIRNIFLPYIEKLKDNYSATDSEEIKKEIQKIVDDDCLNVYHFIPSYPEVWYEAFYDSAADLYYVLFEDKRLYLKRGFALTKRGEKEYIKNIWYEQDSNSPHLYQKGEICVEDGDILVDCGACEGNFSLHHIDKVSKLYLVECNNEWLEALRYTFAPYKSKVVYCDKFLSNIDSEETITLDTLVKEPVDFIKMDIEGEEVNALNGAKNLFKNSNLKCSICCYHRHGDEEKILKLLEDYGYITSTSDGYMLFLYDDYVLKNPELRKGIVYGKKL